MSKQKQRNVTMSIGGLVAVIGCSFVVHGVALAWRPGAWMLAGILIAIPALLLAYNAVREGWEK
jgi:hypothetical protein